MGLPFDYEFGDAELKVMLGPLTVRRIAYSDMAEIRESCAFWNEHWTNIWPWRFLTIRRKSGIFRNFVINPSDREGFASDLRARLPGGSA